MAASATAVACASPEAVAVALPPFLAQAVAETTTLAVAMLRLRAAATQRGEISACVLQQIRCLHARSASKHAQLST